MGLLAGCCSETAPRRQERDSSAAEGKSSWNYRHRSPAGTGRPERPGRKLRLNIADVPCQATISKPNRRDPRVACDGSLYSLDEQSISLKELEKGQSNFSANGHMQNGRLDGLPLKSDAGFEKLFCADCPHALRQAGFVAGGSVLVDHALLDGLVEGRNGLAIALIGDRLVALGEVSRNSRRDPRMREVLVRLVAVRFTV